MTLSTDEILCIYPKLPAKSIYKFKCSCKSFFEFSSEPYLALIQAQHSLLKYDPCFIIQRSPFQKYSEKVEIHPLPREEQFSGVPKDFLEFLENSARILASSNGLLLCRSVGKNPVESFICNPITKSYLPIPAPEYLQELSPEADINVVFECNHGGQDADDYKMAIFESPQEWSSYFDCQVFTPKEGRWRAGKSFFPGERNMRFDLPVYLKGSFHFVSDCHPYIKKRNIEDDSLNPYYRPYIIVYSIEDGLSRMLRVPKEARMGYHDNTCDMCIFKWGKMESSDKYLCLVQLRKGVFTAWVLMDYESSVWVRIWKVRVKAMGVKEKDFNVTDFIVMNGDCLVFATERKLYRFGLSGASYGAFEEICEHECGWGVLTPYSSTLRPCGVGARDLSEMMLQSCQTSEAART